MTSLVLVAACIDPGLDISVPPGPADLHAPATAAERPRGNRTTMMCRPGVPRSGEYTGTFLIHDERDTMVGDVQRAYGTICGAGSGACLHFVPAGRSDYDVGRRVRGEVTVPPRIVPAGARLAVAASLDNEQTPGYDLARVDIRCGSETMWRLVYQSHAECPAMDARLYDLAAGDFGRSCAFRFSFDSVDHLYNRYRGLVITAVGFEVGSALDPDFDGRATRIDNCPSVKNPSQDDSDLDAVGDACDREPYPVLAPAVVGRGYTEPRPMWDRPPGTIGVAASGLPPGLRITGDGVITGTPTADGDYPVKVWRYTSAGVDTKLYQLYVFPALAPHQRRMLAQAALLPDTVGSGSAWGTVTRFTRDPVFYLDDSARTSPGGPLAPGGAEVRDMIAAVVPRFTGGRLVARFTDQPVGLEWPVVTVAFEGPGTAGRSLSAPVRPGVNVLGGGEVTGGFIVVPPEWAGAVPPPGDPARNRVIETVHHELGHVFTGPHTFLTHGGFIQQRDRYLLGGSPRWELSADEELIYHILYRLPIGTDHLRLIDLGLLTADDIDPPPIIAEVTRAVSPDVLWPHDPLPPEGVRPGDRLRLWGGHLALPWRCIDEGGDRGWSLPTIEFAGAGEAPIILTTWVGKPCSNVDVIVPEGAVTGSMRVIVRHLASGRVRTSAPFTLTIATP